jgi:hypothetical protein
MPTDEESDRTALGIYAVMARDVSDALDMILECEDVRTLETLYAMLIAPGTERTDKELNALMTGTVKRRTTTRSRERGRMKLGEALLRANKRAEVGDHVVVYDDDKVAHVLYVASVDFIDPHKLGFMCPCMKFKSNTDTNELEVAPHVTCLECVSK